MKNFAVIGINDKENNTEHIFPPWKKYITQIEMEIEQVGKCGSKEKTNKLMLIMNILLLMLDVCIINFTLYE